jgi:mono/diheme cytochrome c family protein
MDRKLAVVLIAALMAGLLNLVLLNSSAEAQTPAAAGRKTIWSGVYTDDEAARGEAIYAQYCVNCHGVTLGGGASAGGPPLAGNKFMENWREDTVENLFLKIKNTMPRIGFQGSDKVLSEREALDTVAFIFKQNSFPAGSELSASGLTGIRIELQEGPQPLPAYSQLQVVGCMDQEASNWVLAKAAQPVRLRGASDTIAPEVLKAAESKPLGDLKFPLQNLLMLGAFKPADHKGHKMLAQGVLIRQGRSERISVTHLEMVSTNCN